MRNHFSIQSIEISKTFRHRPVLESISFDVREGACYVLFGVNGAGKTTLLKILAGLQRPSSGRFTVLGFDGQSEQAAIREHLFFLGHQSALYDALTAAENLRFAMGLRGRKPTATEIKRALDRVEIGPFANLACRYLSAGMKRRLSIAAALLALPSVLLLDEVYMSLDEAGTQLLHSCLQEWMKRGAAILMSSHNPIQARQVATEAGVLVRGRLQAVEIGTYGNL